jgi:hypothetical protein
MSGGHLGSSGRYNRLRDIALDFAFLISQVQPELLLQEEPSRNVAAD